MEYGVEEIIRGRGRPVVATWWVSGALGHASEREERAGAGEKEKKKRKQRLGTGEYCYNDNDLQLLLVANTT